MSLLSMLLVIGVLSGCGGNSVPVTSTPTPTPTLVGNDDGQLYRDRECHDDDGGDCGACTGYDRFDGELTRYPADDPTGLLGEELRHIGEGFELERVAGGVIEEHGGLFADFAFEADVGFDLEVDAGVTGAVGQGLPDGHLEDDAEVGNRDGVTVDRVGVALAGGVRGEVRDDLVTEEVEVDPLGGTAALGAARVVP